VTIWPRELLDEIHGWPDLNYFEDRYTWGKACKLGRFRWTVFSLYSKITMSREKRSFVQRAVRIYGTMRDKEKIGGKRRFKAYTLPLLAVALVSAHRDLSLRDEFFKDFWPHKLEHFLPLSDSQKIPHFLNDLK
jgi:hypothetical protein